MSSFCSSVNLFLGETAPVSTGMAPKSVMARVVHDPNSVG